MLHYIQHILLARGDIDGKQTSIDKRSFARGNLEQQKKRYD